MEFFFIFGTIVLVVILIYFISTRAPLTYTKKYRLVPTSAGFFKIESKVPYLSWEELYQFKGSTFTREQALALIKQDKEWHDSINKARIENYEFRKKNPPIEVK